MGGSQVWDRRDCATGSRGHEPLWTLVLSLAGGALRTHLVIHGVHPVGTQGLDRLADEICPPAVEHAETQVLVEFFSSRWGIQPPEGTETAFGSAQKRPGCVSMALPARTWPPYER